MDIRVHNSVIFGLSETVENFIQEGGRVMRGCDVETQGRIGFAFFLHKGQLGIFIDVVMLLHSLCRRE